MPASEIVSRKSGMPIVANIGTVTNAKIDAMSVKPMEREKTSRLRIISFPSTGLHPVSVFYSPCDLM